MTLIDKLERTAKYIDYIEERTGALTIMEEGARELFREAAKALRDATPAPVPWEEQKSVFHKGQLYTVEVLVRNSDAWQLHLATPNDDTDRLDKLEQMIRAGYYFTTIGEGVKAYNDYRAYDATTLRELIDTVKL